MPTRSLIRLGKARVCKVRGFTLNYNAKHLMNFDVIRNVILNPENETMTANKENQTQEK
jgi:hypothetical protein